MCFDMMLSMLKESESAGTPKYNKTANKNNTASSVSNMTRSALEEHYSESMKNYGMKTVSF